MNLYPLKLESIYKSIIWGGERLSKDFGYANNSDNIAEAWSLTLREKEQNTILNGFFSGKKLADLLNYYTMQDLCGKDCETFPLLIKLIDAKDNLSVQVHPDDEYAQKKFLPYGKTECWYIVDAKADSKLVFGMKNSENISKEIIKRACLSGTLEQYLNYIPVKKGETYFIPAGTVHAIGEGILIAEVQQNSDTTYRMYDYNRKDNDGNLRQLHLDDAINCMKNIDGLSCKTTIENGIEKLCICDFFSIEKHTLNDNHEILFGNSMKHLLILDGFGKIIYKNVEILVAKGDSIFIPKICENTEIYSENKLEMLVSTL